MGSKSVIEKLWEVNPEAEIWWDSSPIIYDNWRAKMIQKATNQEEMRTWLDRLYHKDNPPDEKHLSRRDHQPSLVLQRHQRRP